jgi:hypothetical protein
MANAKEPSRTIGAKQLAADGRYREAAGRILGRSPATGRFVLKPASKRGTISLRAAMTAVKNVGNGHKT